MTELQSCFPFLFFKYQIVTRKVLFCIKIRDFLWNIIFCRFQQIAGFFVLLQLGLSDLTVQLFGLIRDTEDTKK